MRTSPSCCHIASPQAMKRLTHQDHGRTERTTNAKTSQAASCRPSTSCESRRRETRNTQLLRCLRRKLPFARSSRTLCPDCRVCLLPILPKSWFHEAQYYPHPPPSKAQISFGKPVPYLSLVCSFFGRDGIGLHDALEPPDDFKDPAYQRRDLQRVQARLQVVQEPLEWLASVWAIPAGGKDCASPQTVAKRSTTLTNSSSYEQPQAVISHGTLS